MFPDFFAYEDIIKGNYHMYVDNAGTKSQNKANLIVQICFPTTTSLCKLRQSPTENGRFVSCRLGDICVPPAGTFTFFKINVIV